MYSLIIGLLIMIAYGVYEKQRHLRSRKKIPFLIHVNGTRGKSSVTRLITAGLRGGGFRAMGKTTGSAPRIIFEDGSEIPVVRNFGANVREQLRVIRFASKRSIDYIVMECMAVNPEYQWVTEHKMLRSDIGVITNTREDHLDLMGPGIRNCVLSLCNTVPFGKKMYTSEYKFFPLMKTVADERETELIGAYGETVTDEEISGFSHIEHKDNVALALKICTDLGIKREDALKEMYNALPDIGAAEVYHIVDGKKEFYFANFFAANDPESSKTAIEYTSELYKFCDKVFVVLSTREDRMYRSEQLAEMMATVQFDNFILVGNEPKTVRDYCLNFKIPKDKITALGFVSGEEFTKKIFSMDFNKAVVIGIGNIHGNGTILMEHLLARKV